MASLSLNKLVDLFIEARRLGRNPSPVLQAKARDLMATVAKHLPSARLEPEVGCSECRRERRGWFATGVADGRLWPLCCRLCVGSWMAREPGCQVWMRDGREWQAEAPARRAA